MIIVDNLHFNSFHSYGHPKYTCNDTTVRLQNLVNINGLPYIGFLKYVIA